MHPSKEFIDLNFEFVYVLIDSFTIDDPRLEEARKNLDLCKATIYDIATDLYKISEESEE